MKIRLFLEGCYYSKCKFSGNAAILGRLYVQLKIGTEITRERSWEKNLEKQAYVHMARNLAKMQRFCDMLS